MKILVDKLEQEHIKEILINIYNESQKDNSLEAKDIVMEIVSRLKELTITNK